MRKTIHCPGFFALLLLVASLLTGCGSTSPARFYTLTSLAGSETTTPPPVRSGQKVLGVGPVALAEYLDHPGLITRSGPNTVNRSELHRWGGSLGDEVTRVLVENLGTLLADSEYLPLPWLEAAAIDYRIQLNITRFDGPAEGPVVMHATWLLFASGKDHPLASGELTNIEPLQGMGHAAIAEAMSRALFELSRRVSTEIQALASQHSGSPG